MPTPSPGTTNFTLVHLWLNHVMTVGEGTIDVEHARLAMRYYECAAEVPVPDLMG